MDSLVFLGFTFLFSRLPRFTCRISDSPRPCGGRSAIYDLRNTIAMTDGRKSPTHRGEREICRRHRTLLNVIGDDVGNNGRPVADFAPRAPSFGA